MWLPCFGIVAGLAILVLLCASLPYMSIGAGVVVTVTFQQVDGTPHAETGTQSDNQSLKNFDSRVEEFHSLFSFIIKRFRSFVHTRNLVVLRCITAARLIFWCTFLTGIKIKPPTGSGRRERISIHHDELITGVDFFFSVHELLNVQSVLGVIVGGVLNLLFTLNTTALPVLPKMGAKKQQIFFKTYCFRWPRQWASGHI